MPGFDLDKIADPGKPPASKSSKPSTSGGFDLNKISNTPTAGNSPAVGNVTGEDFGDFSFQPKTNADNYMLRAQNQKWYAQAGDSIVNAATNSVLGIGEVFATGLDPKVWAGVTGNDDSDYTNALTKKLQSFRDPLPVYHEHPDDNWDWKDPAWWFDTVIKSTAEWMIPFAAEEKAFGTVFKTLAEAAGEGLKAGSIASKVVRSTIPQVAAAATQSFSEGAQSGAQIFQEVYNTQYKKLIAQGMNPDEARTTAGHTASEAGATTIRTNVALNTMLQFGELAPMFHEPADEVKAWLRTEGKQAVGETRTAWKERLTAATMDNPELKRALMPRHGWSSMPMEAIKGGFEEINTQYAEHKGRREGNGDLKDSLTDLENYLGDVSDSEGALNFALGAFGDVGMAVLLDHSPRMVAHYDENNNPVYKTDKEGNKIQTGTDANGEPVYKVQKNLVMGKKVNEMGVRSYFANVKDAIIADIDRLDAKHEELKQAYSKNDEAAIERTKNELFGFNTLSPIAMGQGENFQETYRQIAALDNTHSLGEQLQPQLDALTQQMEQLQPQIEADPEAKAQYDQLVKQHQDLTLQQASLKDQTAATQAGFAKDKNDHEYKERALSAVGNLKALQKMHEEISNKFHGQVEPDLIDHIFMRKAGLFLHQKAIDRVESKIAEREAVDRFTDRTGFTDLDSGLSQQLSSLSTVARDIDNDLAAINSVPATPAGKFAIKKQIAAKYRAEGTSDADLDDTVKTVEADLLAAKKEHADKIADLKQQLEDSTGFTAWKEKNNSHSFQGYLDQVGSNHLLTEDRNNLELQKFQLSVAHGTFNKIMTKGGMAKVAASLKRDKEAIIKEMQEKNKLDNTENFLRQQSRDAVNRLSVKEKEVLIAKTEKQLAEDTVKLQQATNEYTSLEQQVKELRKGMGAFTSLNKTIPLTQKMTILKSQIAQLKGQISEAQNKLDLLSDQKATAEVKQTVEANRPAEENEAADSEEAEYQEPYQENPETEGDLPQTHYTADELANFEEPTATDGYLELKNSLPAKALKILDKIETEHTAGTSYSYDLLKNAFRPMLAAGEISQMKVNEVQIKLREYLKEKNNAVPTTAQQITVDPIEGAAELKETDTPAVIENEQPLTLDNASWFTDDTLEALPWENSAKTTNAVKGNSSDLQYKTIEYNGKRMLRNVTVNGAPQLDPHANKENLIPGAIQPGHKVYLQIDTDWNGQRLNDDALVQDEDLNEVKLNDSFSQYTTDGKIRTAAHEAMIGYGNVPIKIVDAETGKTLKYFPRADWITARQGSDNFRNVEDLMPPDADGNREPGNVLRQMEYVLAIRKELAERHNANPGAKLHTTGSMLPGRLMYFGDLNESTGKVKYRPQLAEKLLPDTSLTFGVATKDGLMIGKSLLASTKLDMIDLTTQQRERLMGTAEKPRTSVVAYIPMNNGKYMPVPMLTAPLSKRPGEINTVVRAIELYMQHGTDFLGDKGQKLIDQIQQYTGFDISTPAGLKGFIEQYFTLTNGFADTKTEGNAEAVEGKKELRWLFQVPDELGTRTDGKADIKVGTTYSGKRPLRADLKNGQLNPAFRDALIAGLNGRMKNVNLSGGKLMGLGDPKPITAVTINANDVLSHKEYANYNAYAKSFLSTVVYGKHTVAGKHVYAVNGQMILDESKLRPAATANATELISSTPDTAGTVTTEYEDAADELNDLMNGSINFEAVRHIIAPNGDELTLDNLQQLYNFTATEERNAKTPAQVLQYLQDLGISRIADGYNPFIKC
jgi:hypothetical protein